MRYYTVKQATESLNLDERTVREWCKAGKLPGQKIVRKWHISEDALNDALKQSGTQTRPPSPTVQPANDQSLSSRLTKPHGSLERDENRWRVEEVRKAINQVVFLCPNELVIQALLDDTLWIRKGASILAPTPESPQFREAVRHHAASLGLPMSGVAQMLTPYKDALPSECCASLEEWEKAYGQYYDKMMGLIATGGIAVEDLLEDEMKTVINQKLTARGKGPVPAFSLKAPYRGVPPERRDGKMVLFMAALPDVLTAKLVAELLTRVASERPSQGIWAVELLHLQKLKERAHIAASLLAPTPIEPVDIAKLAEYFWTIPEGDDPWKLRSTATEAGIAFEEVSKAAMQVKERLTALL